MEKNGHTISLIIPAHNEAKNIAKVLAVTSNFSAFDEIILVADGCTDETAEIAARFPNVLVIKINKARGKGEVMISGANAAKGDIIMFLDADLKTLTTEHIENVLAPVVAGNAEMSIGLRDRVLGLGAKIPKIMPLFAIAGQRALTKNFFNSLPQDENMMDFGVEIVMNYYAKKNGLRVARPILKNLKQSIKESKYGLWRGFRSRLKSIRQIARAIIALKKRDLSLHQSK